MIALFCVIDICHSKIFFFRRGDVFLEKGAKNKPFLTLIMDVDEPELYEMLPLETCIPIEEQRDLSDPTRVTLKWCGRVIAEYSESSPITHVHLRDGRTYDVRLTPKQWVDREAESAGLSPVITLWLGECLFPSASPPGVRSRTALRWRPEAPIPRLRKLFFVRCPGRLRGRCGVHAAAQ